MSWKKVGTNRYKIDMERRIDGKRRRKTKTYRTDLKGRDLKRFLQNKQNEIYDLLGETDRMACADITYDDFIDIFKKSRHVEGKTADFYNSCLGGHSIEYFSGMKIRDIKRSDVVDFISVLQSVISKSTGKPLSPKTIKHHRDCLRALFNYAIYLEIIETNPADHIKLDPVPNQVTGRYYEPENVDKILDILEAHGDYKYYVFFVLQLYTGCRPSEMYGLTWKKINFDREEITIDQALVKSKTAGGYILKSTKAGDVRVKPLPGSIAVMLKNLKSITVVPSEYVFTNSEGNHLNEGAFREYYRRFCKLYNLPYLPPYAIRHTTGTILASKKIPLTNIANILGHTNPQTTTKYVHATQSIDQEANNILAEKILPKIRLVK